MASISIVGKSERQRVTSPATNATIGAGWYERTRQSLEWATDDREYFWVYRAPLATGGAYDSAGRNQNRVLSFNSSLDPWGMCQVESGSSTVRIPVGRARGWWLFTGLVDPGSGTAGAVVTAPVYSRAIADLVIKVGDSESIVSRDEVWLWRTTPTSHMPHAVVNLDAYPADLDIEIQLIYYQNWADNSGGIVVNLKGLHLHSHTTEQTSTLGTTTWAQAVRWTAGTLDSAAELVPLANAIEHISHDRPSVELYSTGTVSVPTGTNVIFNNWTDQSDTRSWGTASRITVQEQGFYLATATIAFPLGATGSPTYHIAYFSDASGNLGIELLQGPAGRGPIYVTVSCFLHRLTGAYVEVGVHQTSGSTQDVGTREDGAPFVARFNLVQIAVAGATLVNDAKSLPAAKGANDTVSTTEYNQLADTANWHARSRPIFQVTHSGTQTITQGVNTKMVFDTEISDVHNVWSTVNNRFTASIDGWYVVGGAVYFAATDATAINFTYTLLVNGTTVVAIRERQSTIAQSLQMPPTPIYMGAGNYVEMWIQYNFGSTGTKVIGAGSVAGNTYTHTIYGWYEMGG